MVKVLRGTCRPSRFFNFGKIDNYGTTRISSSEFTNNGPVNNFINGNFFFTGNLVNTLINSAAGKITNDGIAANAPTKTIENFECIINNNQFDNTGQIINKIDGGFVGNDPTPNLPIGSGSGENCTVNNSPMATDDSYSIAEDTQTC